MLYLLPWYMFVCVRVRVNVCVCVQAQREKEMQRREIARIRQLLASSVNSIGKKIILLFMMS